MKMHRSLRILTIALLILLACAFVIKAVDTSMGSVSVKRGKLMSDNGYLVSYKIYIPDSATASTPAPAIIYGPGGGSSVDDASMFAIEASRRGFVFIAVDVPGNGQSEPILSTTGGGMSEDGSNIVPVNSLEEGFKYYGYGIELAKSLAFVDSGKLIMSGHSMGGMYTTTTSQTYQDDIFLEIAVGNGGFEGDPTANTDFSYALIVGTGDEAALASTTGHRTLSECIQSEKMHTLFGVPAGEEIEVGKVYGDLSAETGRVVYTPASLHYLEPTNSGVCTNYLEVLAMATGITGGLSATNHVYWIKELAMLVMYAGISVLMLGLVMALLETEFFSTLKLKTKSAAYLGVKKNSPVWYVIFAALTVVCGMMVIWSYQNYSGFPIVKTLGNAGGKGMWSVCTAILLAVYLIGFHLIRGRKQKYSYRDYGLATSDSKAFDIVYILKSVLLALVIFAMMYGLLLIFIQFTDNTIHFNAFNGEIASIEDTRMAYKFFPVLLVMIPFILANFIVSKTVTGSEDEGIRPFLKELLILNIYGTLGMLVIYIVFVAFLLGPHICLFTTNYGHFGAEALLGIASGFWVINTPCLYLSKKTHSVWPGVIVASVIMTWFSIFASGMTF